jgi:hypothetical protein
MASMSSDQIALARMYLNDPGSSALQSILITNATGGTFTVSFDGQTTTAIDYGSGANVLQNALCALSTIGVGNLTVNNSAPYDLYFTGTLGGAAQPIVTVDGSNLTGDDALITASQLAAGGEYAFTDVELGLLYGNASLNFFLAICYAFRVLLVDVAKLTRYTAGQTTEYKEQISDHLRDLADMYQGWAFAGQQVQFTRLQAVPPRVVAIPITSGVPATSLAYAPPYGFGYGPWGRGTRRR